MPRATTVTLRLSHKPVFPDLCAFSGLHCDGATIGFLTRDGMRRRAWLQGAILGLSALGVAAVSLSLVVAWEKMHPPAFNLAIHGESVEFEFLDHDVCAGFRKAEWGNRLIRLASDEMGVRFGDPTVVGLGGRLFWPSSEKRNSHRSIFYPRSSILYSYRPWFENQFSE